MRSPRSWGARAGAFVSLPRAGAPPAPPPTNTKSAARAARAADTAKFGQPEITIGTIPGMGGTQRLPRAVGKAKAMDWCLTGRMIDAAEAERSGLVARVVPADKLFDEALAVATRIAGFSLPVVLKVKEAINRVYESSLSDGLLFERREFHSTFALEDQKEGMRAFVDKRKPDFKHR